ncbi:MAG TPA: PAS domain-containing sensor histidine kinase, partial [Sphingobacteriaceae bacterium]
MNSPNHQDGTDRSDLFTDQVINCIKDFAIFTTDPQGTLNSWSEGAVNVLGYSREEAIGSHARMLYTTPDIRAGVPERELITALEAGTAVNERYHVRKDGSMFWASGLVYPLFDENGRHLGFTKILRNYPSLGPANQQPFNEEGDAELKHLILIKELGASERRLKLAIEGANIGIWDLDQLTGKAITSKGHAQIYGYDPATERWGLDELYRFAVPEDLDRLKAAITEAWISGGLDIEFRIRRKSTRELRWIHLKGEVARDEGSGRNKMIGTTFDITHQKELDRRRDELITIVSHELKTPVTSLKAAAQVLSRKLEKSGDGTGAGMLNKMNTQINRLVTLIGDLLNVSKIEGGHLQLRNAEFSFGDLVRDVVSDVQKTSGSHRIIISGLPDVRVRGDLERTGQVLINLLTNAIKYSPHADRIEVTAEATDEGVACHVRDFGIGIPEDRQQRVFERFYRASDDPNYSFSGIGMGLYISYEIIKRLGGRMWFESRENKGSTFSFSLPLHAV